MCAGSILGKCFRMGVSVALVLGLKVPLSNLNRLFALFLILHA